MNEQEQKKPEQVEQEKQVRNHQQKLLSGLVQLTQEINQENAFFHSELILKTIPEEYNPLTRTINPFEIHNLLKPYVEKGLIKQGIIYINVVTRIWDEQARRFIESAEKQYEVFGNAIGYRANLLRIEGIRKEIESLET